MSESIAIEYSKTAWSKSLGKRGVMTSASVARWSTRDIERLPTVATFQTSDHKV